jgi:hypothetical protein
VTVTV